MWFDGARGKINDSKPFIPELRDNAHAIDKSTFGTKNQYLFCQSELNEIKFILLNKIFVTFSHTNYNYVYKLSKNQ